jgi:DNA polymerase/3'-5' exonuclease PolX
MAADATPTVVRARLEIRDLTEHEVALTGSPVAQWWREDAAPAAFALGRGEECWPGTEWNAHDVAPFVSRYVADVRIAGGCDAVVVRWRGSKAPGYFVHSAPDTAPVRISRAPEDGFREVIWPSPIEEWGLRILRKREGQAAWYSVLRLHKVSASASGAVTRPSDTEAAVPCSITEVALAGSESLQGLRRKLQADRAKRSRSVGSLPALVEGRFPAHDTSVFVCLRPSVPSRSFRIWREILSEAGVRCVSSDAADLARWMQGERPAKRSHGESISPTRYGVVIVSTEARLADVRSWLGAELTERLVSLMVSSEWMIDLAQRFHAWKNRSSTPRTEFSDWPEFSRYRWTFTPPVSPRSSVTEDAEVVQWKRALVAFNHLPQDAAAVFRLLGCRPNPVEQRARARAYSERLQSEHARDGIRLPPTWYHSVLTKIEGLMDQFFPWLQPVGSTSVHGAFPTPSTLVALLQTHCANKPFVRELLRVQRAYSFAKTARGGVSAFKHDAYEALAFRAAFWPHALDQSSSAAFAQATRKDQLTDRQTKYLREFVSTGKIGRAERLVASPSDSARVAYGQVYGVGETRAISLWNAGFHDPLSLLEQPLGALRDLGVTADTARALRHWQGTSPRKPREELTRIEGFLRPIAEELCPGVELLVGGSFRRGQQSCGDIDVILFHPQGPAAVVPLLVAKLASKEVGFLVEHLRLPSPVRCVDASGRDCEFPGLKFVGADPLRDEWEARSSATTNALLPKGVVSSRAPEAVTPEFDGSTGFPALASDTPPSSLEAHSRASSEEPRVPPNQVSSSSTTTASSFSGAALLLHAQSRWTCSSGAEGGPSAREPCGRGELPQALDGPQRSQPGFHDCQMYQGIAQWTTATSSRMVLRIDIKSWHCSQRGAAMVAFTGNSRFNRAIRRYAEAAGFHLNDKALCVSVGGVHSHPRECTTEEEVFHHLGLEWRAPHERLMFHVDDWGRALDPPES